MKRRAILLVAAFMFAAAAACFASNVNVGSWKLNEAKSKIPTGAPKNTSVVYTADGDNMKAVVEGVDGEGKPSHSEWTGKFDGKDYPVTGDPAADTRSLQTVDDHHFKLTTKKGGKTTVTGTVAVSADGKTRTLVTNWTDKSGKKMTATMVYDKQ